MNQQQIDHLREMDIEVSHIEPLAGDVSTRRYFRLHGPSGSQVACVYPMPFDAGESALARWKAMCANDPNTPIFFASDPVAYLETTRWFLFCGIPVPKLLAIEGPLGMMVMEDVGDCSLELETKKGKPAHVAGLYADVLEYLRVLASSTDEAHEQDLLACHIRLDHQKLFSELSFTLSGAGILPGVDVDAPMLMELSREFDALCEVATSGKPVLCHRDYHSRNLFVTGETIYVLDHQDLRLGHRFYDRASLLWDPYAAVPLGVRRAFWASTADEQREELRAVIVQRLLKALGTYINVLRNGGPRSFLTAVKTVLRDLAPMTLEGPGEPMPTTQRLLEIIGRSLDVFDPG